MPAPQILGACGACTSNTGFMLYLPLKYGEVVYQIKKTHDEYTSFDMNLLNYIDNTVQDPCVMEGNYPILETSPKYVVVCEV
jgi:hypothetical protein